MRVHVKPTRMKRKNSQKKSHDEMKKKEEKPVILDMTDSLSVEMT